MFTEADELAADYIATLPSDAQREFAFSVITLHSLTVKFAKRRGRATNESLLGIRNGFGLRCSLWQ